jgi:hypothetical protein
MAQQEFTPFERLYTHRKKCHPQRDQSAPECCADNLWHLVVKDEKSIKTVVTHSVIEDGSASGGAMPSSVCPSFATSRRNLGGYA